jgi:hypothetical protein
MKVVEDFVTKASRLVGRRARDPGRPGLRWLDAPSAAHRGPGRRLSRHDSRHARRSDLSRRCGPAPVAEASRNGCRQVPLGVPRVLPVEHALPPRPPYRRADAGARHAVPQCSSRTGRRMRLISRTGTMISSSWSSRTDRPASLLAAEVRSGRRMHIASRSRLASLRENRQFSRSAVTARVSDGSLLPPAGWRPAGRRTDGACSSSDARARRARASGPGIATARNSVGSRGVTRRRGRGSPCPRPRPGSRRSSSADGPSPPRRLALQDCVAPFVANVKRRVVGEDRRSPRAHVAMLDTPC